MFRPWWLGTVMYAPATPCKLLTLYYAYNHRHAHTHAPTHTHTSPHTLMTHCNHTVTISTHLTHTSHTPHTHLTHTSHIPHTHTLLLLHSQVRLSLVEPSMYTTEVIPRAKRVGSKRQLNTTNGSEVNVGLVCVCVCARAHVWCVRVCMCACVCVRECCREEGP